MSDISFVTDEEEVLPRRQVVSDVPSDYVAVKLSSAGKLSAPHVIHVKDYSVADVINLATSDTYSFMKTIISVLNNVIYEGFDCAYLTEQELEEVMLNILGNFWTPVLQGFPYPYEQEEYDSMDDERKERISKGLESLTVDIPLSSLETIPIRKDFSEPITIISKEKSMQFILPRVRHYLIAQEYIEKKYAHEYQEFSKIEQIMELDSYEKRQEELIKIPRDERLRYNEFTNKRGTDYIIAKQAQLLVKIGSKPLTTIEEKFKAYSNVNIHFWKKYDEIAEELLNFGVNHNIKMTSPITKEEVIRRCQFRPMDYVPSSELQRDGEYSILFGEQ